MFPRGTFFPGETFDEFGENNATTFVWDWHHSICPEHVFYYRTKLTLQFFYDANHRVALMIPCVSYDFLYLGAFLLRLFSNVFDTGINPSKSFAIKYCFEDIINSFPKFLTVF